jgi:hypothetical protein
VTEARRQRNYAYFAPIYDEIAGDDFHATLYTYLMNEVDLNGFRPMDFPITQARDDITEYNRSYYELFIIDHLADIEAGILFTRIYDKWQTWIERRQRDFKYTQQKLGLELGKYCVRVANTTQLGQGRGYIGLNANGREYFATELEQLVADAGLLDI